MISDVHTRRGMRITCSCEHLAGKVLTRVTLSAKSERGENHDRRVLAVMCTCVVLRSMIFGALSLENRYK